MVENHIQTEHNQKEKFRNNKLNNSTKTKNIIAAAVALALSHLDIDDIRS